MIFQKATKKRAKLRLAIIGPSGSGKTFTALTLATRLGPRVAVIDTERGSASKYADKFGFDVLELDTFSPLTYVEAIREAEKAGYDVIVIDSLSHAWSGKNGALEQVDNAAKRSQSGNTFGAWREVTPMHNAMIDAIIGARAHVIATMRAKTDYVQEKNERTGKTEIRKVGIAPVQRDGMEYEFDVVADMDQENNFIVSKTRCPQLHDALIPKPDGNVADVLKAWLDDGAEPVELRTSQPTTQAQTNNGNGGNGHTSGHWIDDPETRKRFWQFVSGLNLTEDEVHGTLGKSVRDFSGTKEQAITALKAVAADKAARLQAEAAAEGAAVN